MILKSGDSFSTTSESKIVTLQAIAIFTSSRMGNAMIEHDSIRAIANVGLEADRYSTKIANGAYSAKRTGKPGRIPDLDRQVSLISLTAIAEANAQLALLGIAPFTPSDTRRNLVIDTSADVLNNLVGKVFKVGDVTMEGVELCTPCKRPPSLLGRNEHGQAFETAFEGRGGLRARVLSDGTIFV